MWNRVDIKECARLSLRRNYLPSVIVSLLLLILAGCYQYTVQLNLSIIQLNMNVPSNYIEIFDAVARKFTGEGDNFATRGVLSALFRNALSSGSVIIGALNAVNYSVFSGRIAPAILAMTGMTILFAVRILIRGILQVGGARFFMESASYPGTSASRTLYLYKIRRLRKTLGTMLYWMIYILLWCLTIVGGVIAAYSTYLVPYIVAENPDISRKDAMRLSREMMRGNRRHFFMLDMSFVGWYILSLFTFGLLSILFVNPYAASARAGMYLSLRRVWLKEHPEARAFLNDGLLDPEEEVAAAAYPQKSFAISEVPARHDVGRDYERSYSVPHLILIFFSFAVVGWLWEVCFGMVEHGLFINRGTMAGPWLPMYGVGGLLTIFALQKWRSNVLLTFFLSILLCGTLEYITGALLERFWGLRWWDYTGYLLNLNGRICVEGLIVFGLAGCFGIYVLGPILDNLFQKVPRRVKVVSCVILVTLFVADLVHMVIAPNSGALITTTTPPDSAVALLQNALT